MKKLLRQETDEILIYWVDTNVKLTEEYEQNTSNTEYEEYKKDLCEKIDLFHNPLKP